MSSFVWGALMGAAVGFWGAAQRNMALHGGRLNLQGMDLVVIILSAVVAAVAGGAVAHGLAGMHNSP